MSGSEKRWSRVGLTTENCERRLRLIEKDMAYLGRYLDKCGPSTPDSPCFDSYDGRCNDLFIHYSQLETEHLEIEHSFGPTDELIMAGKTLALDLFCGEWRDAAQLHSGETLDRAQCRTEFDSWFDQYRQAMVLVLIGGTAADLQQLAGYIGEDLFPDDGAWGATEGDRAFYRVMASYILRGITEPASPQWGRNPKQMLNALKSIEASDNAGVTSSIQRIAAIHSKKLSPRWRTITSLDASVIWHLATSQGIKPKLAPAARDLVLGAGFRHETNR